MSTFVVGDVHGCAKTLAALLRKLDLADGDTLIFVGDYIAKGPDSKGVIDQLLLLKQQKLNVVPLMGNHESMLLHLLTDCHRKEGVKIRHPQAVGRGENYMCFPRDNGYEALAGSYGFSPDPKDMVDGKSRLPAEHEAFLADLSLYHIALGCVIVHAGLSAQGLSYNDLPSALRHDLRDPDTLLWTRATLDSPPAFREKIIHGHTPRHIVRGKHLQNPGNETLFQGPVCEVSGHWNIDTGVISSGRQGNTPCLTALKIPEFDVIQQERLDTL